MSLYFTPDPKLNDAMLHNESPALTEYSHFLPEVLAEALGEMVFKLKGFKLAKNWVMFASLPLVLTFRTLLHWPPLQPLSALTLK